MAVLNATKTVVGVFNTMEDAQHAVRELESSGFVRDDISLIANKNASGRDVPGASGVTDDTATTGIGSNVAADAGIGAALGGIGGLIWSFAALGVPGVGPVLAAGPIIAALSGAGIGAVTGGVIGALTQSGIPEDEAHHYAEGVRRGGVLVTVHTNDADAERARDILDRAGAVDMDDRASNWRDQGWTGHDPGAEPLSADELRREREYYSSSAQQGRQWSETQRLEQESDLPGTMWPHREATTIGESLPRAEAENAALDRQRTAAQAPSPMQEAARDTGAVVGDVSRPLLSDRDNPQNFSDTIENNVRRPDPATVRAERGFDRAKESAVQSARRLGSRVYDVRPRS